MFALICTADVSAQRINDFLTTTYTASAKVDCQPSLVLVSSWPALSTLTRLSKPEQKAIRPTTSVTAEEIRVFDAGKGLEKIAEGFRKAVAGQSPSPSFPFDDMVFVILDERSKKEDDALVVHAKDNDNDSGGDGTVVVDTVRVAFDTVNSEIIKVSVLTGSLQDSKFLAGKREDGVVRLVVDEGRKKGGPAPRKMLG